MDLLLGLEFLLLSESNPSVPRTSLGSNRRPMTFEVCMGCEGYWGMLDSSENSELRYRQTTVVQCRTWPKQIRIAIGDFLDEGIRRRTGGARSSGSAPPRHASHI